MLAWLSTRPAVVARLARSPLKEWLNGYLAHLTAQGYPIKTLRKFPGPLLDFGDFLARQGDLDLENVCLWVEPFLATAPLPERPRSSPARTALNGFLRYLRQAGAIKGPETIGPPGPGTELVEAYCASLRTLRALRFPTIRHIRGTCLAFMAFLADEGETPLHSLQPQTVHRFLISQGRRLCRSSLKTQCTWLRGYLSYLHCRGVVALDLSRVVVAPRVYEHDGCPRFLTRAQIESVLAAVDRETPVGRRDFAMLQLLTAYGLRGMEVARLRLDDIDWRNRKLHVCGRKVGNSTTYPLAASVDDAIVAYLRNGRPVSSHREVFLSVCAPFRPLANGWVLSSHIAKYLCQAGITVKRPGTHLFRYSCAQRLFEEGMSLKIIGDYLGHTHAQSTLRYTKIAFDQLREVALDDVEELL